MKQPSELEHEIIPLLDRLIRATRLDLSYTVQIHPGTLPEVTVQFSGPDTPMLLDRSGELLQAIEHLGVKICGLEPAEQDRLVMDADQYKARRDAALLESADHASAQVRATGQPFTFSPMSSHERRQLHLALTGSGLHTESTGTGMHRAVVLYPAQKPGV